MKIVECDELAAGKSVQIGDIIIVGTKGNYRNNELDVTEVESKIA